MAVSEILAPIWAVKFFESKRMSAMRWVVAVAMLLVVVPQAACVNEKTTATENHAKDVVILFDNDAHCAIDGYAKMAWLKETYVSEGVRVCVVSCGDFLQGNSYGLLSKGELPVSLMNTIGYDCIALGNHEFDYGLERLMELTEILNADVLCTNFTRAGEDTPVFTSSTIRDFGDMQIAFVGVTTPKTMTSSTPAFFQNEEGEYLYSFNESLLVDLVQREVNQLRRAGTDYVVILSHLGNVENGSITSQQLIGATEGIDMVLDGHAHSVIVCDSVRNKAGKYVKRSSTGASFAHIGKLSITQHGVVSVELLDTKQLPDNPFVSDAIQNIEQQYNTTLSQLLGTTLVPLRIYDNQGVCIARKQETNIGDFVADAFRNFFDVDIGWVNGGGLRNDIDEGTVTYGDMLAVLAYGDKVVCGCVKGQVLLDNLEMSYRFCPIESGGFAQLSGIRCEIDTNIASSVVVDSNGILDTIGNRRRVKNVQIYNRKKQCYEFVDPNKEYSIAASMYVLQNKGDGQHFAGIRLINNGTTLTDAEIVSHYLKVSLSGKIGEEYASPKGRIMMR